MALRIFLLGVLVFLLTLPMFYLSIASPYIETLWWWDMPMHIVGGMWAGLIGAWFLVIAGERPTLAQCVCFALYCGLAVEILEYLSGWGANPVMPPAVDTAKDFVMDAIGGYLAHRAVFMFHKI